MHFSHRIITHCCARDEEKLSSLKFLSVSLVHQFFHAKFFIPSSKYMHTSIYVPSNFDLNVNVECYHKIQKYVYIYACECVCVYRRFSKKFIVSVVCMHVWALWKFIKNLFSQQRTIFAAFAERRRKNFQMSLLRWAHCDVQLKISCLWKLWYLFNSFFSFCCVWYASPCIQKSESCFFPIQHTCLLHKNFSICYPKEYLHFVLYLNFFW